ncbi:hypothetical protein HH310_26425 [Actinoplanes sp. TBRC 11911]|uniref:MAB_1171c family putative transporter n=1 Tax=Actinoplanes sp. TBRC 11911 TaxID=2729386 RepID=UPI00145E7D13|nr:MAB_1171c family putative transporter [Actinoplanes sp. TBRC 11911]NMO54710.1 hypothetical protein [Actinoplanes sp. TBRC 11911]
MVLTTAVLLVLWGVVVVRLPTLWRDRRQRTLWAAILCLALARTAAFDPVDERLGVPTLAHLFGVLAAYFLLRFIALATGRGGARWQPALALGVLVALEVLAVAAGGIDTRPDLIADDLGAAHVAYWVILEAYLGAVLVTASRLFASVAHQAPPRLPRLGLRAMAAGTALVALYASVKSALIIAYGAGVPVDFTRFEPVARVFQGTGLLLVLLGLLVPATRRIRSAVRAYRSLLVLRPLWTAMHDAFPEVILFSPRRAVIELAGVDDVHLRLYRRVIEIRDGMLALRGFLPATYAPQAYGEAGMEAQAIALALHRRETGEAPSETPGTWAAVGPEMADEVAWLSLVSSAFRRISPGGVRTPTPFGSAR